MLLAECKVKQNKPYEALAILDEYIQNAPEKKEYLAIRAVTLKDILNLEKTNSQIMDEFNKICDKIRMEYGDSAMVEELRQQNLQ